eukprot:191267-Rhodomonas_salina.1
MVECRVVCAVLQDGYAFVRVCVLVVLCLLSSGVVVADHDRFFDTCMPASAAGDDGRYKCFFALDSTKVKKDWDDAKEKCEKND